MWDPGHKDNLFTLLSRVMLASRLVGRVAGRGLSFLEALPCPDVQCWTC